MLIFVGSLVCQTSNKKKSRYFSNYLYQVNQMTTKLCILSVQALFKLERKPVRDYNLYDM